MSLQVNLPPMNSTLPNTQAAAQLDLKRKPRLGESIIQGFLFFCGAVSILTTIGIVFALGREALLFFQFPGVTLTEFFTGTKWSPSINQFGVLPLLTATFLTSTIAMFVALPLGLAAAVYLSEYAKFETRRLLKPVLEVLAGIPTVVYGFFALTFITPILRGIFSTDTVSIYNMLSAGLVMGIMITPLVCSMSEDALQAVPRSLREGSYGLGATKLETSVRVVFPAALSGITAAVIVAISRAVGETMIVAIASGAGPNFTLNPFQAAETMTGHIARISGGDLSYNSIDYDSIFAIGLLLFIITLILNLISREVVKRFREVYE
jgi:phosphate transport system permease protein